MYGSFFVAAAQSPTRQSSFRSMVTAHLAMMLGCIYFLRIGVLSPAVMATFMVVAGVFEGAILVGWRLTQMPKSRALEFILASPLRPTLVFATEATIGILFLALVTLSGLPLWLWLILDGYLQWHHLPLVMLMPFVWGTFLGLNLSAWAYEPERFREWMERFMLLLVLVYLVLGVMAGEHLGTWFNGLPKSISTFILTLFYGFHQYNPFAVTKLSIELPSVLAWEMWPPTLLVGVILASLLFLRAAMRFQGHYHERHYKPAYLKNKKNRRPIGEHPLNWWAIKRVSEYSGKVNLWLAGGFGILYALHTLAGDYWPSWMGRQVFLVFDHFIGLPGVATALVVLAATPAAFQYGLWDSNTNDRCQRLELLLMTELTGVDYWRAALNAAWFRGAGYFYIAILLWLSAAIGGQLSVPEICSAIAAAMILWFLYFTMGFRAFTTGLQANGLGMLLTTLIPLASIVLFYAGYPALAAMTPPGSVYSASTGISILVSAMALTLFAVVTLIVRRKSLANCERELRLWYEKYHGKNAVN